MDLHLLMGLPHLIHQGIEQGIEAIANVADIVVEWTSQNEGKSIPKVPCRSAFRGCIPVNYKFRAPRKIPFPEDEAQKTHQLA